MCNKNTPTTSLGACQLTSVCHQCTKQELDEMPQVVSLASVNHTSKPTVTRSGRSASFFTLGQGGKKQIEDKFLWWQYHLSIKP